MRILLTFSICLLLLQCALYSNAQSSLAPCDKKPLFKENGGKRITTFLNRGKVKREKIYIEICEALKGLTKIPDIKSIDPSSSVDTTLLKSIAVSNKMLVELSERASAISPKNVKEFEELLGILQQIRELKCKRIDPIVQFLKKNTNKLYSDVSFRVGASEISQNGRTELGKLVQKMQSDIKEWRNYVSDCNERVFENDLFILVIDISGYADQQGTSANNLLLSEERAKAVKVEITKQLNLVIKSNNVNLIFDKIQTKGQGEALPPGVIQKGEDDPARRVCLITSIVGPSLILK